MENTLKTFYAKIEEQKLNVDGLFLIKNDQIVSKAFWKPYDENQLHRMYSISKSLTMIAIGLLLTEKKIKLTDPITKYFDYDVKDDLINQMTIKDLLTMKTTFTQTTYKKSEGSWLESFFITQPDKKPGTIFSYDTSASYVLSALVEKLSGMKMLDYVKKYFNFSKESYMIPTTEGISHGGSTLMATLNDLKLLGDILKTNGLGIIDEAYMKEAKKFQSDTRYTTDGFDFTYGYGYQTWLNSKNGFTMYGMAGQLVYYDKDHDITLITVSNLTNMPNGTQMLLNLYHQYIGEKASLIHENQFYAYQGERIKSINQPVTNFNQTYQTNDHIKIDLSINYNIGALTIGNQKIEFSLKDQIKGEFPNTKETYIAQGIVKPNKLYITLYLTSEELGTLYLDVSYDDETIVIVSKGFSENYLKEWNFNIKGEKK